MGARKTEQKLRILLVEDSPLLCSRLVGVLQQHPELTVVGLASAEDEAISKATTLPFDAMVVDVELRPGTGINVIRRLRESERGENRASHAIVVLTNYDLPAVRERCLEAGADFFFDKMRELGQLAPALLQIARERAT